jgi:hypothetical protein
MPQEPIDLNKEFGDKLTGVDLNEIRNKIVQSVLAQLYRSGSYLPTAAGYTQSEGKNYGKYEKADTVK